MGILGLVVFGLSIYGLIKVLEEPKGDEEKVFPKGKFIPPPRKKPQTVKHQSNKGQFNNKLSQEQRSAFEQIEKTNKHYFITGKAGTGKTHLLHYLKKHTSKRCAVVAPTGVAAIQIGGQTIHSFFKFPPRVIHPDQVNIGEKTAELLRHLDLLIIDEISMVRADLMDAIGIALRQAKRSNAPFGGTQIVMLGDLYQLPPVVNDRELQKYFYTYYGGPYFFQAHVWQQTEFSTVKLNHIFRQKDQHFISILNKIRAGEISNEVLEKLNQRVIDVEEIASNKSIILTTTNNKALQINENKLAQIDARVYCYQAKIEGDFGNKYFPTEEFLRLKEGAQIIMLKNDPNKRWVNGSLGVIHKSTEDSISVKIDNRVYQVPPAVWNRVRYKYNPRANKIEEEVIGSFIQFPLRLAWAITIHKSQGRTYNSVIIDLDAGAFAHGQTYVALSRCQSLEKTLLTRPVEAKDIIVDPTIVEFYKKTTLLG